MEKAAGGVLVPRLTFGLIDLPIFAAFALTYLLVRSARQAYSAEVATKAGSACGLARGRARFGTPGLGGSDNEPF